MIRSTGFNAKPHALIDLYVPARLGTPEALQALAAKAGLDAIVLVAEDAFELPNAESVTAVNSNGGPRVLVAPVVAGPGYRFELLLPPGEVDLEPIEAAADPRVVHQAVTELGGLALAVSPRQGVHGDVARKMPVLAESTQGVVALVSPASRLGRDLDFEDAAAAERPILGASGPFATLADLGRYATLLPIEVREGDLTAVGARVISALQKGRGIAVEIVPKGAGSVPKPDPHEGRSDDRERQGNRGGRRRRRRGGKGEGPKG